MAWRRLESSAAAAAAAAGGATDADGRTQVGWLDVCSEECHKKVAPLEKHAHSLKRREAYLDNKT